MGSEAFVASGDKEKAERVSRNERPTAATIEAAESETFVASGDKEKAERVSRNERPTAATIEAADAARRRETSAFGKAIVLNENRIMPEDRRQDQWRNLTRWPVKLAMLKKGGRSHLWTR